MIEKFKIPLYKLKNKSDLSKYRFETTKDIEPSKDIIGQIRGVKSLEFGLSIKQKGYNIYVSGCNGTGRTSISKLIATKFAQKQDTPPDWCYVYNFNNSKKPIALKFKTGDGKLFKLEVEDAIEEIKENIMEAFLSINYEEKKDNIYKNFKDDTQKVIKELNQIASKYDFVFKKTENGLESVPIVDGEQVEDEDIDKLSDEQLYLIKKNSELLEKESIGIANKLMVIENKLEERLIELDDKTIITLVESRFETIIEKYSYNKKAVEYILNIKEDIVLNVDKFIKSDNEKEVEEILIRNKMAYDFFKRYEVNSFVDNSKLDHAPVIEELSPKCDNLLGNIEYFNEGGVLDTDHTKIKAGSIHRANGGYLVLNIKNILCNHDTWKKFKESLKCSILKVENLNKGSVVSENIKPDPIPLNIKIMLIGDDTTYQLLYNYDYDFKEIFRIKSDFDTEIIRNDKNINKVISFISKHCKEENLKPFDKGAIESIIDYSSRLIEHQEKMTIRFNDILEVMYEADAWAELSNSDIVMKYHISKAIKEKAYRNSRYEERIQQSILDGNLMIDTKSKRIGEINGLSVMTIGEYTFGKPNKITVSTFIGKDGIVNIEREVNNSGDIYDKGVLILGGFIGEEFAKKKPLSIVASITFEQSYGPIDGDSASSTELYALLSSLSEIPINQGIATTGSINQKGLIQPIGGVNEKIEGFFKVCEFKGLNGNEGVIIPYQNIENLMLNDDVIDAVEKGKFNIYAIKDIKEGIEILTGLPYGIRDKKGKFDVGTIGYFIERKLENYNAEN